MKSLIILSLMLTAAMAQAYTVRLGKMPKDKDACWDKASLLASRFTAQTGIAGATGICVAEHKKSYEIHIEYTAETPVNIIRVGHFDSPLRFDTQAECQTSLTEQDKLFADLTGLEVFTSFCFERDSYFPEDRFEGKIFAFGSTETEPRVTMSNIFGKVYNHSATSFKEAIVDLYSRYNATATAVKITPSFGTSRVSTLYYGKERLFMHVHNSGGIPTAEQCLAEVADLQEDLKKSKIMSYCAGFTKIEVNFAWLERNNYSFLPSGQSYETFDACKAQKVQSVQKFSSMVAGVKSGFCNQGVDEKFTLTLIKENN